MGGPGSGSWDRWRAKKSTVEESLCLTIRDFRGRLNDGATGTIAWTSAYGHSSFLGYSVKRADGLFITLKYLWRDSDVVQIIVPLQTTPTQFGGKRWWFTCPLSSHGADCNRRALKLYLPPGARYLGCRACHDLTYESSQTAHSSERQFLTDLEYHLDRILGPQR